MEFYERMRELRKEHGETQAQVAAAAGMTDRQYQRFETGKQKPGFDSLLALADHFGVSLDYLAGRSDRREMERWVSRRSEEPAPAGACGPFLESDIANTPFSRFIKREKNITRFTERVKGDLWN